MRIVVTGAAGGIGRTLIPLLCARPEIAHVAGIDRVPATFSHPKLSFRVADILQAEAASVFEGADAIVHLAFSLTQGSLSVEAMRANNVVGSLNVFRAAREFGVRKVVNLSSVSVYGQGENLDEQAPLAPSSLFPYAQQKAELERAVNRDFADIDTVHLRSTFVLGPNATRFLRWMFTGRVTLLPRDPYPNIQVVHENDVASAIINALEPSIHSGTFNVAAPEVVTVPELVRNKRKLFVGIPISWVEQVVGTPPETGLARPVDSALELFRSSLTVSCEAARNVLGWSPKYDAWDARKSSDRSHWF